MKKRFRFSIFGILVATAALSLIFSFFFGDWPVATLVSESGLRVSVYEERIGFFEIHEISRRMNYKLAGPDGKALAEGDLGYITLGYGNWSSDYRFVETNDGRAVGLFLFSKSTSPDSDMLDSYLRLVHLVKPAKTYTEFNGFSDVPAEDITALTDKYRKEILLRKKRKERVSPT